MAKSPMIVVVVCLLFIPTTMCFMEWLFGDGSGSNDDEKLVQATEGGMTFEMPTADHKFLQLKDVLDSLSPLDACYHIVVYKLKKRCGQLSEEDLGKLSVQLLNCQSSAEERPTYSCTESMTLSECTRDMDNNVWNSYHIVSNRARSLCYATQQQQFRKLTEATVNKLMSTAHGQLEYMQQLQAGQEQLHFLTTDTVRKLYESQNDLIGNQENLRSSQNDVLSHIHRNIAELMEEKAMIATGNKELAGLTENIRTKLDKTTEQLLKQEMTQLQSHEKILEDLTHIQHKSHDALSKLDNSSQYLMRNHHEMMTHYGLMYNNMVKINHTVSHLLTTVNSMQENLDERINWFTHLLNLADDKLSILTCGALHLGYFLFAALAASFIQTPAFSRLVLFLLVSVNATMEMQCGHSLDFASISLVMVIICAVNWVVIYWCRRRKGPTNITDPLLNITGLPQTLVTEGVEGETTEDVGIASLPLSANEVRQLASTLGRLYTSLNESIVVDGGGDAFPRHSTPNPGPSGQSLTPGRPPDPSPAPAPMPGPSGSAFTQVRKPEQVRPDSSTVDDVTKVRRYLLEQVDENSSLSGYSPSERSTPRQRSGRSSSRRHHGHHHQS